MIDPEEKPAENFAYTIICGPEGKDHETQEIIEAINAYLKGGQDSHTVRKAEKLSFQELTIPEK